MSAMKTTFIEGKARKARNQISALTTKFTEWKSMGSETTQMSNEDEKQAKHKCNGNELNGKCMESETTQMSAMKTKSKEAWNQISAMKTKFIEWESNEFNEDEIY